MELFYSIIPGQFDPNHCNNKQTKKTFPERSLTERLLLHSSQYWGYRSCFAPSLSYSWGTAKANLNSAWTKEANDALFCVSDSCSGVGLHLVSPNVHCQAGTLMQRLIHSKGRLFWTKSIIHDKVKQQTGCYRNITPNGKRNHQKSHSQWVKRNLTMAAWIDLSVAQSISNNGFGAWWDTTLWPRTSRDTHYIHTQQGNEEQVEMVGTQERKSGRWHIREG